jgi:carbonic anhydrase
VWEYEGDIGPEYWNELCVDYTPCGGTVQSPVNIEGAVYDPTLADIPQTYNSTATHTSLTRAIRYSSIVMPVVASW